MLWPMSWEDVAIGRNVSSDTLDRSIVLIVPVFPRAAPTPTSAFWLRPGLDFGAWVAGSNPAALTSFQSVPILQPSFVEHTVAGTVATRSGLRILAFLNSLRDTACVLALCC